MKLCDIHIRDPFIINENGKYYMYGSRMIERCNEVGFGADVYVSTDFENWQEKAAFTPPADFWATRDFWAPEVHKYRGKYYMFISLCAEGHNRGTQILVSDSPEGPFKVHSDGPVTPREWMCLDGTLYVDKKGKPYMVFCHEWVQVGDGEMCAIPLTDDLKSACGQPRLLFKASQPVWSDGIREGKYVTDGPFMYTTKNGRLMMTWSSFHKGAYCVGMAYSDNGEIDGNWTHDERMLFENDGGHGMIFDKDGKLYFIFHSPNSAPDERAHYIEIEEKNDTLYAK